MKYYSIIFLFFILLSSCEEKESPIKSSDLKIIDFNALSEQFILYAKQGKDTKSIQKELANTSVEKLNKALGTDNQRFAFWINIYNAYIQVILKEKPEYYKDRDAFFSKKHITIAGEKIAFAKIEHGILRKSQWDLGFGYFRTWFPNKFEKTLRVKKQDYRIHFALNCGAKDCPPVAIYTTKHLNEQLKKNTELFLKQTSTYNSETNEVAITSLFNWFRGDFGGESGVKKILRNQNIIPNTKEVTLKYTSYDWTLELDNFID